MECPRSPRFPRAQAPNITSIRENPNGRMIHTYLRRVSIQCHQRDMLRDFAYTRRHESHHEWNHGSHRDHFEFYSRTRRH